MTAVRRNADASGSAIRKKTRSSVHGLSIPRRSRAQPQRREPMNLEAKCPFHFAGTGRSNRDWWPEQLRLDLLAQHSSKSDPMDEEFNYAEEFKSLDLKA